MNKKSAAKTRKRSLKGQKLRAKKSRSRRFFLGTALLLLAVSILYFKAPFFTTTKTPRRIVSWEVVVAPSLVTKKSSSIKPILIDEVKESLKFGYEKSALPALLNRLAVVSKSDNVYLFRSGISQITVFGTIATPLFKVSSLPNWGVSKEGHLYEFDFSLKNLPYLAGVFSSSAITATEARVGRHQGNQNEKDLVSQAVELMDSLKSSAIEFKGITHLDYRGFEVKLANEASDIIIGYAPFSAKSLRLREVLSKLSLKNRIARRIELDFDGKIFIKE